MSPLPSARTTLGSALSVAMSLPPTRQRQCPNRTERCRARAASIRPRLPTRSRRRGPPHESFLRTETAPLDAPSPSTGYRNNRPFSHRILVIAVSNSLTRSGTIWEHRIAVIGKCPEDVCHSLDQVLRNEPSLSAWVGHLPTQGPTHLDENHVSSQVLENERGLSDCCRDWAAGRPVDFSFLQITNAKNTTVPAYPFRRDVSLSLQDTHSMVRNQSSGENGGANRC